MTGELLVRTHSISMFTTASSAQEARGDMTTTMYLQKVRAKLAAKLGIQRVTLDGNLYYRTRYSLYSGNSLTEDKNVVREFTINTQSLA